MICFISYIQLIYLQLDYLQSINGIKIIQWKDHSIMEHYFNMKLFISKNVNKNSNKNFKNWSVNKSNALHNKTLSKY